MAVELPGRCVGDVGCRAPVLRMNRCVKHLREFEQEARDRSGPIGLPTNVAPKQPAPLPPAPVAVPSAPAKKPRERADMAEHRKIVAEPPPAKYLTFEEVEAHRRTAPRWIWLWDLLENMPSDKCALEVNLPDGLEITRFANMIRTALSMQKRLNDDRWSVRKTMSEDSVIITKVGTWKEYDAEQAALKNKSKAEHA